MLYIYPPIALALTFCKCKTECYNLNILAIWFNKCNRSIENLTKKN